jgi:hypothetical protein
MYIDDYNRKDNRVQGWNIDYIAVTHPVMAIDKGFLL